MKFAGDAVREDDNSQPRDVTLGELIAGGHGLIQTGPFGSQLHARDYVEEGTPVVMPKQLGDNTVTTDGIARITDEDRDRLSRHVMREGDIVFSRRGDVTRRAYISAREAGWLCGTGCLLLRLESSECNNRYLARYLGLPSMKSYLTQHAVGATMPNLNQGILGSVPVRLPRVAVQNRVVVIFSAYDDLIENNRRRIALLEEAARLLYREWFVHLRFPGHEHVAIRDGVPEGWEKTTAYDAMAVLGGGTPKTKVLEYWDGGIPFYTPKDAGGVYVSETEKTLSELGLRNCSSRLYPRDTLFITARGTVGKVNLAAVPMAMNQSCYALVARPPLNQYFLYFAVSEGIAQFQSRAVGAVFDAIIRDTFKLIPFVIPTERLIQDFTEFALPVLCQIDCLLTETRKLTKARDLLLPRLMSGEIAV